MENVFSVCVWGKRNDKGKNGRDKLTGCGGRDGGLEVKWIVIFGKKTLTVNGKGML